MILLLLAAAIICAVCILAVKIGDDTVTVEPEAGQPTRPCDVASCHHIGWVRVTWRGDLLPGAVCAGHYDEGTLRGWWQ